MAHRVKRANENVGMDHVAMAYPTHSTISPKKFAPDTYSNIPPRREKKDNWREKVLKVMIDLFASFTAD